MSNAGLDSRPSRTSIIVAALRAFGAREPDARVRNPDWLAERLLGPTELKLISEHPIVRALQEDYAKGRKSPEVSGMANLLLIRTLFIDEHMRRAVESGARQVVVLGAGFDTRAYRCADLLKDAVVFEVDSRSTQQLKKRRLEEVLGTTPSNVRFVEIDFRQGRLDSVLLSAGFNPKEKSFFIWEGVSMYLSEEAVRATLRTLAEVAAPGSSLVMDYASRAMIDLLRRIPRLPQHRYTTAWGEPWLFGVPDNREHEFFLECGFRLRETLAYFGREAAERYLVRSDGPKLGPVRGESPPDLLTMLKLLWIFLTHRGKWYAIAELSID